MRKMIIIESDVRVFLCYYDSRYENEADIICELPDGFEDETGTLERLFCLEGEGIIDTVNKVIVWN